MKCSFCGHCFEIQEGQPVCGGRLMSSCCGKTKCPRCGYEVVPEPGLVKLVKKWRQKCVSAN